MHTDNSVELIPLRLMYNWGDSAKNPLGYVDYIRMGAIEDDPANKEPFFWAVGDWEVTDVNDKSYMTVSIKRVSAGQYAFVLVDNSAAFCNGDPGGAEFKADTFSNIASSTFEFVCDPGDRRGYFEYKFTYNSASDQIVDSYGVIWNRKK